MTKLYLVRHGAPVQDYDAPPSQWVLSEEGRAQAEALANEPFWKEVKAIYSSTEPKALATAEPAARRYGLPLRGLDCLGEVARPAGQRFENYEEAVARFLSTPKGTVNGGWEPNARARGRIGACVWRILDPGQNIDAEGPIAIVGHGLTLTLLIATLQNQVPSFEVWESIHQPDWAQVEVYVETCLVRGQVVEPFSGARQAN